MPFSQTMRTQKTIKVSNRSPGRDESVSANRLSIWPTTRPHAHHYKKTGGFWWPKWSEIRRNRPILTNFWRTNSSVSFCQKKSIRRNFVRPSDDFLTTTEKRHSDELPTIFQCGHTRPEFIEKTIYRRRTFLRIYRRTKVRRKIPTD